VLADHDLDLRVWWGIPIGESFIWYVWSGNCFQEESNPNDDGHGYYSDRTILPGELECAGYQPGGPLGDSHNNVELVRIRASEINYGQFYVQSAEATCLRP